MVPAHRRGLGTSTGNGGIASAIPLITKGRAEAEGSNVDMNYFLGIDATTGVLVADFEERRHDRRQPPGHRHHASSPATSGTTPRRRMTARTWRLYLDGALDGTLAVGAARRVPTASSTPRSAPR